MVFYFGKIIKWFFNWNERYEENWLVSREISNFRLLSLGSKSLGNTALNEYEMIWQWQMTKLLKMYEFLGSCANILIQST